MVRAVEFSKVPPITDYLRGVPLSPRHSDGRSVYKGESQQGKWG